MSSVAHAMISQASQAWPGVDEHIKSNVLYWPIADAKVRAVPTHFVDEDLVDLISLNNPRLCAISTIDPVYANTYKEFSLVRQGVSQCLQAMLTYLPDDLGICFFEGWRPLYKQKEYFDKKYLENLSDLHDPILAYEETTKSVSPFIQNIPTHATGAAVDITLFAISSDGTKKVLDMGQFDTIYGPNDQQETFSTNTTDHQRENRIILLHAAIQAGLVNYGYEWWHFSYGDKAWAYVKGGQPARYGLANESADDPLFCMTLADYIQNMKKIAGEQGQK